MMDVGQVTLLLRDLHNGQSGAFDQLVPLIYEELRRMARAQLRRSPGQTIQTTALVHEVYLKMADQQGLEVENRQHLIAVSAHAMRQVLVDFARARMAAKRGGNDVRVTLEEHSATVDAEAESLIDIDNALSTLRKRNERLARVVECRFFAGMSEEETAEALGTSLRTAQREWMRARAWLREALRDGD